MLTPLHGMKMSLGCLVCLLGISATAAESITIDPAKAVIVLPANAESPQHKAAEELAYHLKLITGTAPKTIGAGEAGEPGQGIYRFFIGTPPTDDTSPFAPEESRWKVTADATYLYGEPGRYNADLFAVYSFLEDQLGVRWIQPGEVGVVYEASPRIELSQGESSWIPKLEMRKIRPYAREGRGYPVLKDYVKEYADFMPTHEDNDHRAREVAQWQDRMRMGGHSQINYGHAFVDWWDKYGKTHPDYFALNQWGKREPELRIKPTTDNPAFSQKDKISVKICPSNPAVAEQIVQNWVDRGQRSKWVNACLNDQIWGFCRCENCLTLDVREPGEKFPGHLTDRYVHLANEVARRVRKYDPEAGAVMYAYDTTLQPPRKLKLEPNIAVVIVPTDLNLETVTRQFKAWEAAGAQVTLMRPNYPTYFNTLALPIGHEKQMYDVFDASYETGAVGADYDALIGLWQYTGLSDYVTARQFYDPEVPFETWEREYYSAYGAAAEEVGGYFRYWREQVWDKRLKPNLETIVEQGRYYNFARGLYWSLGDYYKAEDFDQTDALLAEAAKKDLTPQVRQRLNQLILANQNARLLFNAVTTKGVEKFKHSKALLAFRQEHITEKDFAWFSMFATEARYGDMTGSKIAQRLSAYPLPWIETAVTWHFKMDPQDVGLDQSWHKLGYDQSAAWDRLRVDFFWDNPYDSETDPDLMQRLKGYDGIGWYATQMRMPDAFKDRKVMLYFGAVDESCWIYVNGELAGEHVFQKSSDWSTPFEIDITDQIDWSRPTQDVVVRVEDKGGSGGIWKRVWLVSALK